jgi:hypothetical protein
MKYFTKNYSFRISGFFVWPHIIIGCLWSLIILTIFLGFTIDYIDTLKAVIPMFVVVVALGFYPLQMRCTLTQNGLRITGGQVDKELLFADMAICINSHIRRCYLSRFDHVWFPLKSFPIELLRDLFEALPPYVKVEIKDSLLYRPLLPEPSTPDVYLPAKLAAVAVRNLNSDPELKSLIVSQILISLSQESSIGDEAPGDSSKVSKWKNWLAREFGEQVEAYAYMLEGEVFRYLFYFFVVPAILTASISFLMNWELITAFFVAGGPVCLWLLFVRIFLLWQYKDIAKEMIELRANDGTNTPRPENHHAEQLGDKK